MKKVAIIFAGGTGQRMHGNIPKQFLKVCGKEIIIHTIELFENNKNIDEIYVICVETWINNLEKLIKKNGFTKITKILPGGKTGQDSIFIGLEAVKKVNENAIVLIHDGVRPLVANEVITKCVKAVEEYGTAITVTPCYETPVKSINGKEVSEMPSRQIMYTAQAPQCFHLNLIYEAHMEERKINPEYNNIVDSCGLLYKRGIKCHLVEGNRGNIKVTTPEDFCTLISNFNARDYQEFLSLETNRKKAGK